MKKYISIILTITICLLLTSCTNKNNNESTKSLEDGFGKYPQTLVTDDSVIKNLAKITKTNEFGYIEYNQKEYLKYKENYYLVEPITWISFNVKNKTYYITEKILDRQVYMSDEYFEPNLYSYLKKPGVPEKTHANNYYYSDLREWLNSYFISTAFTNEEIKTILKTSVDNSLSSTNDQSNPYVCSNTEDYLFALSCLEAEYLQNRSALPTDYAIARGVVPHNDEKIDPDFNGYAVSWLRTPSPFYSYCVSCINYDGNIYRYSDCYYEGVGVRPAFVRK